MNYYDLHPAYPRPPKPRKKSMAERAKHMQSTVLANHPKEITLSPPPPWEGAKRKETDDAI